MHQSTLTIRAALQHIYVYLKIIFTFFAQPKSFEFFLYWLDLVELDELDKVI